MATPRSQLARAPAREALIDIRFEPLASVESVTAFAERALSGFESKAEMFETLLGLQENAPATTSHTLRGWRLDNPNSHFVLMCRDDGFTMSRLSPYGRWEDLRDEAKKWWTLFDEVVRPGAVTRIAVRYINAIRLPLPIQDFSEYLVSAPSVPAGLPQGVTGFLHRVIVPDHEHECTAVVTQALEGPPVEHDGNPSITVLLDIDVSRMVQATRERAAEAVWNGLDELRVQKNRLFFSYLTDKTVEMFE